MAKKPRVSELWFLSIALFHNVLYQCMKFQVDSSYSLEDVGLPGKNSK